MQSEPAPAMDGNLKMQSRNGFVGGGTAVDVMAGKTV